MENFTNETLDLTQLPKFEEVQFTALHRSYWSVTLIGIAIFFGILGAGLATFLFFVDEFSAYRLQVVVGFLVLLALTVFFSRIAFQKKGFAFRNHDVLYRHGIIANTTMVIPYNRIQHVALHEGLISRSFGLAEIQIFTAGGKESDLQIPGIEKSQAENIKQLLMGKIQKQL